MGYNTNNDILLDAIRKNTESITVSVDADGLEINTDALETINTAIKTAVEVIDNAISGSEMQVDIVSAGANDLLKFGNSGVVMINGTDPQSEVSGTYFAVQFITECTLTTFTMENSTTVTGVFPAGTVIYGDVRTITASASNIYVLYKGNPA
tara:strand:+ start:2105 stop:2560 length:456 start_codon:yes stop_codon:yes gene_type:complete